MNGVSITLNDGSVTNLQCEHFVNAAGPWAGDLMAHVGIHLPVYPRKRYVYVFDCPKGPGREMPLSVDPSGVYCRPGKRRNPKTVLFLDPRSVVL